LWTLFGGAAIREGNNQQRDKMQGLGLIAGRRCECCTARDAVIFVSRDVIGVVRGIYKGEAYSS
jgi:hypothetical protein